MCAIFIRDTLQISIGLRWQRSESIWHIALATSQRRLYNSRVIGSKDFNV